MKLLNCAKERYLYLVQDKNLQSGTKKEEG
jgi:hypothetical protein